jgi:hypothetical protein
MEPLVAALDAIVAALRARNNHVAAEFVDCFKI